MGSTIPIRPVVIDGSENQELGDLRRCEDNESEQLFTVSRHDISEWTYLSNLYRLTLYITLRPDPTINRNSKRERLHGA
jgi:hypothetical protein